MLRCNNFRVIDLGVMVPAEKILETVIESRADILGLSGLITPSLDEMVHVAKELQRQQFKIPLLIGGATTSARHTAVRISPQYEEPVVHVKDASLAVPAVENLIDPDRKAEYVAKVREQQQRDRDNFADRQDRKLVPYAEALDRRYQTDWASVDIPKPSFTGLRTIEDMDLSVLREYIDWTPFFMTWQLIGKYPKIFDDELIGEEAGKIFKDANSLLDRVIAETLLTAKGVYGFWPASSYGDDIIVQSEISDLKSQISDHSSPLTFPMLRQQWERKGQKDFRSLADYIAPADSGRTDYVGAFAVTAGHGCDELVARFEAQNDDYNAIMAKAVADRLAEAFAEYLHQKVRCEWGYGKNEELGNDELIAEKYRGIRPAFGYPACPDHTPKKMLWKLLDAEARTGIRLTESYAMWPAAAVSGLYFAHPQARYFTVDRVTRDQVESYARRTGMTIRDVERWLAPILGYDT